ncbi:MAG: hypothetical protein GF416_01495 [Candidatus Altiarchaeales archaeon]|nr:hypothetical protein [Candidatus Altiarchaeales archaeon]MBD3415789.1 hypothetical protein [Candidatus Altiarchaeales archaeon]
MGVVKEPGGVHGQMPGTATQAEKVQGGWQEFAGNTVNRPFAEGLEKAAGFAQAAHQGIRENGITSWSNGLKPCFEGSTFQAQARVQLEEGATAYLEVKDRGGQFREEILIYPKHADRVFRVDMSQGSPRFYRSMGSEAVITPDTGKEVKPNLLTLIGRGRYSEAKRLFDELQENTADKVDKVSMGHQEWDETRHPHGKGVPEALAGWSSAALTREDMVFTTTQKTVEAIGVDGMTTINVDEFGGGRKMGGHNDFRISESGGMTIRRHGRARFQGEDGMEWRDTIDAEKTIAQVDGETARRFRLR